jgi:hypothetical protein
MSLLRLVVGLLTGWAGRAAGTAGGHSAIRVIIGCAYMLLMILFNAHGKYIALLDILLFSLRVSHTQHRRRASAQQHRGRRSGELAPERGPRRTDYWQAD